MPFFCSDPVEPCTWLTMYLTKVGGKVSVLTCILTLEEPWYRCHISQESNCLGFHLFMVSLLVPIAIWSFSLT